jgi:hypothetical protein
VKPIASQLSNAVSSLDLLKPQNLTLGGKQVTAGAGLLIVAAAVLKGHYDTKAIKIQEGEETKRNRDNQNAETDRLKIEAERDIELARIQAQNSTPRPAQ